jgi:hypothetical protein
VVAAKVVAVDPTSADRLYLVGEGDLPDSQRLLRSDDAGATAAALSPPAAAAAPGLQSLVVMPDGTLLLAGRSGLLGSSDHGDTFNPAPGLWAAIPRAAALLSTDASTWAGLAGTGGVVRIAAATPGATTTSATTYGPTAPVSCPVETPTARLCAGRFASLASLLEAQ